MARKYLPIVLCGISDGFDIQQDNMLREDGDS